MNRRNVLLGLGTAAAGSGIVFGSGAFTQVQASRDVSIGVSTDGNALVELHPNPDIQSVFQSDSGDNEGELAVDTKRLSDESKGFNVGSTVQIGATTDPFGDEVDISDPAFEIINRFDDSSSSDDSNFDGTIDVGIDLSSINPSDEEQINGLEFIASQSGSDDGDASSSKLIKAGDRKVFTGLEPGSDGDDDRVAVAIRVETSNADGRFSIEDAITIQAGSDLTAGDFPNERAAPANSVENQDTEETYSSIQAAIDEANKDNTLFVGPGTYTESVAIDTEGLTLQGADDASSTIIGQSSIAVSSTAPNVEIADLRIENPDGSRAVRVTVDATGVVIQDNTVTNVNTNNKANQPRGIVVGGLDGGDSADGLEIRNNTVTNVEGADTDKEQAHAIQILEESNREGLDGDGLIENVVVDGNTIENITDTRSTVAVNFNGNIEGEITNNDISGLNTEGNPNDVDPGGGFTQVIALNAGGNAADGPQNVTIEGNDISDIETTAPEEAINFAPPFHIIIGSDAGADTISIENNDFSADSVDPRSDVYVGGDTGDLDLDAILNDQGNTFNPNAKIGIFNTEEEDVNIIIPENGD